MSVFFLAYFITTSVLFVFFVLCLNSTIFCSGSFGILDLDRTECQTVTKQILGSHGAFNNLELLRCDSL